MTALFKANRAGMRAVLNSGEAQKACHEEAVQVARNVGQLEADATDVVVDDYKTDRAASSVTIRHVQAKTWAVRDGIWSKAASAAGLEISDR